MKIAQQLKAKNIAEYLIYMWQVEDLIRANECDIDKIRENIISRYPEEEYPALEEWYGNLIDMMRAEGVKEMGHLRNCTSNCWRHRSILIIVRLISKQCPSS